MLQEASFSRSTAVALSPINQCAQRHQDSTPSKRELDGSVFILPPIVIDA